jgi:hypothetical protein
MHAPLLVVAGFAVVTTLVAWSRWLAGRRWAAAGNLLLALLATALVAVAWPVLQHLSSYPPAVRGQAVAEVFFERVGAGRFRATLTRLPSGRMQVFELAGGEWRIEARALGWSPRAAALGLRPRYRLEQLSARPAGTADGPAGTVTFMLEEPRGTDVWLLASAASDGSRIVRPSTLAGTWQPMSHVARFEVRLDGAALAVRPRNSPDGDAATAGR